MPRQVEYNDWYSATYSQNAGATSRAMTVTMSATYLAGAGSFDVTVPALSSAGGWLDS